MQLRSLQLFCSVAQLRSFSRAAGTHGVTQSAASQAVQHLEEHLGVQLIDRSKRPLVLTHAGHVFHDGVLKLLGDYRSIEQEVRSLGRQLQGKVTVAAIYSVGLSYMPDATAEFAQLHPGVEVRIEYASPSRVVELARDGAVDFALISYPQGTRSLRSVLWQREPMRLISAPDHPLASRRDVRLSDLNGISMIGFDPGLKVRREIDHYLARHGVAPKVVMEFDNLDSIIRAIQASRGIGILPEASVRRETAAGSLRVVACDDLSLVRPLGIIRRRSGRLGPAAREFAAMLLGRPLEPDGHGSGEADGRARRKKPPSPAPL